MQREGFTIDVDASIEAFADAMAEIPGVSAKSARDAAKAFGKAMEKGQSDAAKASKKAAKESSDAWRESFETVDKVVGKAATGIAGLVGTMGALFGSVHANRQEMILLSDATGIQLDTMAGLQAAARASRVEFDEVAGGFEDFGELLFDAANGGGRAIDTFKGLNIAIRDVDGTMRPTNEVLLDSIAGMRELTTEAERNTAAQQLFGDAGNRLNAILGDMSLEEWTAMAREAGMVIDQEAVQATRNWTTGLWDVERALRTTLESGMELLDLGGILSKIAVGFTFLREVAVGTMEETWSMAKQWVAAFRDLPKVLRGEAAPELEKYNERFWSLDETMLRIMDDAAEVTRTFERQSKAMQETTTATRSVGTATLFTKDALESADGVIDKFTGHVYGLTPAMWDLVNSQVALAASTHQFLQAAPELDTWGEGMFEGAREAIAATEWEPYLQGLDVASQAVDALADVWGAVTKAQEQALRKSVQTHQAIKDQAVSKHRELLTALEQAETDFERAQIQREAEAQERVVKREASIIAAEQARLQRQHKLRKAAEIASVSMSGLAASMAALSPVTGLGPIAGAVLAGSILATMGANIVAIKNQPAPQLDTGGSRSGQAEHYAQYTKAPDNYQATLRDGEVVLNQRASEATFGPDAAAKMNATGQPQQDAEYPAQSMDPGWWLGQMLAREITRGRAFARAVRRNPRTGVRPNYR